jgi:cell fate regulator YaaT (PSP1 superfamily)
VSAVHLVQVGLLGSIGKFAAADRRVYARDAEVVCRTARGLEVGKVICEIDSSDPELEPDGAVLRRVGREDRAIVERLDRFRDRAFAACTKLLAERDLQATLVDVEHLFDGQSIWFYFLGDVSPEVESLTEELAEVYESKVKFRKFAETLAKGCGPDCGTGVSCRDCSSCALGGCGKK